MRVGGAKHGGAWEWRSAASTVLAQPAAAGHPPSDSGRRWNTRLARLGASSSIFVYFLNFFFLHQDLINAFNGNQETIKL